MQWASNLTLERADLKINSVTIYANATICSAPVAACSAAEHFGHA